MSETELLNLTNEELRTKSIKELDDINKIINSILSPIKNASYQTPNQMDIAQKIMDMQKYVEIILKIRRDAYNKKFGEKINPTDALKYADQIVISADLKTVPDNQGVLNLGEGEVIEGEVINLGGSKRKTKSKGNSKTRIHKSRAHKSRIRKNRTKRRKHYKKRATHS